MAENEIIAEIHRYREELAREHNFDVEKLSAHFHSLENSYAAKGWNFVSFADEEIPADTCVVREQPPK